MVVRMLLDFELADKGLDGQIVESVASSAIVCQFLSVVAINGKGEGRRD